MTLINDTDIAVSDTVAQYLVIPLPQSDIARRNVNGIIGLIVDYYNYKDYDNLSDGNELSRWHNKNYPFLANSIGAGGSVMEICIIRDKKPQGVNGGTFTANVWQLRNLNDKLDLSGLVSLASNKATVIKAGMYYIKWFCPSFAVSNSQSRLVCNGNVLALGSSDFSASSSSMTISHGSMVTQLTIGDVLELQHYCLTTRNDRGLGQGEGAIPSEEIYSQMELWKLQ